MYNYVPLEKVLPRIPKAVRDEEDVNQLLSYALEGYRLLEAPASLKNKIELVELQNHKALLPEDLKMLNMVFYMKDKFDTNEIDLGSNDEDNSKEYSLAHRLVLHEGFYNSQYFNSNFYPLAYRQGGFKYSDCCLNKHIDCADTFTVDENKVLWSNLKDGWVCIDYETEMMNDGTYLIIENSIILQYLSYFVQSKHLENRSYLKEQGVAQILNNTNLRNNLTTWYNKASNYIMRAGLDKRLLSEITNNRYNVKLLSFVPNNYRTKYEVRT